MCLLKDFKRSMAPKVGSNSQIIVEKALKEASGFGPKGGRTPHRRPVPSGREDEEGLLLEGWEEGRAARPRIF
jgi:hypothetical protein